MAFSKFGIVLVYGRAATSDGIMIAPVHLSFNSCEYAMGIKVDKINSTKTFILVRAVNF